MNEGQHQLLAFVFGVGRLISWLKPANHTRYAECGAEFHALSLMVDI
ncbi:hypothetical protein KV201_19565 [Shewanella sp. SR1]|nr:hypothetical protein [Shewanella sp. SR1]MCB2384347.1 hypothetical protein [Shewanella sp. SR1]